MRAHKKRIKNKSGPDLTVNAFLFYHSLFCFHRISFFCYHIHTLQSVCLHRQDIQTGYGLIKPEDGI